MDAPGVDAKVRDELGKLIDATNNVETRVDKALDLMARDVKSIAEKVDKATADALTKAADALEGSRTAEEKAKGYDVLETSMRDAYAKIESRMDELEAAAQRPRQGGRNERTFEDALNERTADIQEFLNGHDRGARVQIGDVPRLDIETRALPNLGDTQLGAIVQDHYLPTFDLLRAEMVGFLDLIPKTPPVRGDTIKAPYWTRKGKSSFVQTLVNGAITGDVTPVNDVTVDSTAGFVAGSYARFYTAGSGTLLGRVKIASIPDTTSLIFATDAIDFAIADDDECMCEAIAATAEQGTKPPGYFENALASVTSQTIAVYTKLTRQVLADSPQLASYIQGELRMRLRESLELHCLYGTGTAPLLDGFMNHASLATDVWGTVLTVGDTMADLLTYAAGRIPGRYPKVCVMSSGTDYEETGTAYESDWNKLVRAKADDGHYIHGRNGPISIVNEPGRKSVGAVRVVETQQMLPQSALVIDPRNASTLIPRAGMTNFEMSYVGNDFIQNLTTLLYEEGWAHMIKDAAAFRALDFSTEPSAV
jgi:hypothetical protein